MTPADGAPAVPGRWRRERWLDTAERIGDAYGLVLLLVIATVALSSLLPATGWWVLAPVVSCGMTGVVGLTSSRASPRQVVWAVAVAVGAAGITAVAVVFDSPALLGIGLCAVVVLLAVAMVHMLLTVVRAVVVDTRTLVGAVSVYAAMGVLFTFVFRATDHFQGGMYFVDTPLPDGGDFIFFSYTTLTTTGYGNLVPAGQPGKLFAMAEMLMGQIFLVTLVAGLVTLWRPPLRGASRSARRDA